MEIYAPAGIYLFLSLSGFIRQGFYKNTFCRKILTISILYYLSVFCNSKIKIRSIDQNTGIISTDICVLYTIIHFKN